MLLTMQINQHLNRCIVRKMTLGKESGYQQPVGDSPAERLKMMWQVTQDCWAFVLGFVTGYDAKQEFQRHFTRLERLKPQ